MLSTPVWIENRFVAINISDLRAAPHWIATIAQWQFELWGPLTGSDTVRDASVYRKEAT